MAAVLTLAARKAIAAAVKAKATYLAFSRGSSSWDSPSIAPNPTPSLTDVVDEFARVLVLNKQYVFADNAGEIITDRGNWSLSPGGAVTNHVYYSARLEKDQYPTEVIREMALFFDGTTQVGLPGGQTIFTPSQVTAKGTLFVIQRVPKITRSAEVRQIFETVVTF